MFIKTYIFLIFSRFLKLFLVYVRGNDKKLKEEFEVLTKVKNALEEGKHVRFLEWNEREVDILNKYLFLTAKPMIYLMNMSKKEYLKKKSKFLMPLKQKVNDFLAIIYELLLIRSMLLILEQHAFSTLLSTS